MKYSLVLRAFFFFFSLLYVCLCNNLLDYRFRFSNIISFLKLWTHTNFSLVLDMKKWETMFDVASFWAEYTTLRV